MMDQLTDFGQGVLRAEVRRLELALGLAGKTARTDRARHPSLRRLVDRRREGGLGQSD